MRELLRRTRIYAVSWTLDSSSVAGVQTMEWTDERMDDMADRMDAGFERVDGDPAVVRDTAIRSEETAVEIPPIMRKAGSMGSS